MSSTYVFTLSPARPGRLSGGDGSGPPARSDTILAALRSVSAETGLLGEAFGAAAPPFVISSVFTEIDGVRLYPRPLAEPAAFASLDLVEAEFFRRLWSGFEFVTEARLESLVEGRRVRFEPEDIIEGRAWGMPSERFLRGLPRRSADVGLAVDRAGGGAERFARSRWFLPRSARLFFVARLENPALLAPLKELVARLGESGIGGRRSSGAGRFSLEGAHPAPWFLCGDCGDAGTPARSLLLLSLYLPSKEEVERGVLEGAAVDLAVRGGWISSGGPTQHRKLPVRMLVEGTVLPRAAGRVAGEVRDVTPEGFAAHRVWRDGRVLAINYGGAA